MGKIKVQGHAMRKLQPDLCEISMEINVEKNTASDASRVTSDQFEKFLLEIQKLGVEPQQIEINSDSIRKSSSYHSDDVKFIAEKSITIVTTPNLPFINSIRHTIESGFDDISFRVTYKSSDEIAIQKDLLKEAIEDSKAKAQLLAEAMGRKVSGFDTANFDDNEDVSDLTDEDDDSNRVYYMRKSDPDYQQSLSDQLRPEDITIEAEVSIVWIVE